MITTKTSKGKIGVKKKTILLILLLFLSSLIFFNLTKAGRTTAKLTRFVIGVIPVVRYQGLRLENIAPPAKIFYSDQGGKTPGLLFEPQVKDKTGAVIISAGIKLNSKNAQAVMKLANALQEAGVFVLIPLPSTFSDEIVSAESIKSFVNGFEFLANHPSVDPAKIGFLGFCAGGAFALLAAEDPGISKKVAFVSTFAPYASLTDLYIQTFSEKAFINGEERTWKANATSWRQLLKNFFVRLPEEKDRKILLNYLAKTDGGVDLSQLTPAGKFAVELVQTKDLAKVSQMIQQLPENMQKDLIELSPLTRIENLSAKVFIIHDQDDNYIPIAESIKLKQVLGDRASFLELKTFNHTVLDKNFSLFEFLKELPQVLTHYYQVFDLLS